MSGATDVTMSYSVVDISGINAVSSRILANAAAAQGRAGAWAAGGSHCSTRQAHLPARRLPAWVARGSGWRGRLARFVLGLIRPALDQYRQIAQAGDQGRRHPGLKIDLQHLPMDYDDPSGQPKRTYDMLGAGETVIVDAEGQEIVFRTVEGFEPPPVEMVEAHGKHVEVTWDDGLVLHTHMRMKGSWHLYRPGERWMRARYDMRIVVVTPGFQLVALNAKTGQPISSAPALLSASKTRLPRVARHAATFTAVVVFPTPPFWLATAIRRMCTTCG